MSRIYLDIETLPAQSPVVRDAIANSVRPPATYKKPESIAEWHRTEGVAAGEAEWLKTSFDGGLGHICCIGWAIDNQAPQSLHLTSTDPAQEARLLSDFFSQIHGRVTKFIGHNLINFDLRFLWQRAMVLGVKPPANLPRDPKPWSELVDDTMVLWAGAGNRVSLDKLCGIFGLEGKGEMDGSKVWPAFQDGRIEEIAAYCRDDVSKTRAVHQRLTFQGI